MYTKRTRNRGYFIQFLLFLLQRKRNTRRYAQRNLSCEDLQTGIASFSLLSIKTHPFKPISLPKHLSKTKYRNIHPASFAEGVMKTKPGAWIINSFKTRLNKLKCWVQLHSISKRKRTECVWPFTDPYNYVISANTKLLPFGKYVLAACDMKE
jgi:hypothetical protein